MSNNNSGSRNQLLVHGAEQALDQIKYEIAQEFGVELVQWSCWELSFKAISSTVYIFQALNLASWILHLNKLLVCITYHYSFQFLLPITKLESSENAGKINCLSIFIIRRFFMGMHLFTITKIYNMTSIFIHECYSLFTDNRFFI